MSAIERFFVKVGSNLLSKNIAYKISKAFLATQGTGWGGPADGIYGSGEYSFLKRYLKKLRNPLILDVGANVGDYSLAVLKVNKNSAIHCFEPSKYHIKELKKNLSDYNVQINSFGLSNNKLDMKLYQDKEISGIKSLIKRDLNHLSINFEDFEIVKLSVGDEYVDLNKLKQINLLKIDVEGWEMQVLEGFTKSFRTNKIEICQFEFGHANIEKRLNFRDFYNFFSKYDYTLGIIKPNGRLNFIEKYDEIHENYYCSNFLALSKNILNSKLRFIFN